MIEQIINSFQAMSAWEYIAVVLGLAYIVLAMRQSLWCWPAAFLSTIIYTLLFWQGLLYMESLLNFYYLLMAIYGWWQWRGSDNSGVRAKQQQKPVITWSISVHLKSIAACTIIALCFGFYLDTHTKANMAYLDSMTTVFAVFTTYLVTQKVLENWLYWIVIDFVSIYLYWQNGFYPTAILFIVYTFLAWQGYKVWRHSFVEQRSEQNVITNAEPIS